MRIAHSINKEVKIQTPYRISFVGGGSDLPAFYKRTKGAVISTTFNKFIFVTIKSYKDHNVVRLTTDGITEEVSIEEIKNAIIRESLKVFGVTGGIAVEIKSEISPRSGLGSSSSLAVSLIHGLSVYFGESFTKTSLAEKACKLEIDILGQPIGKQDQFAAAYGGINHFVFNSDSSVTVEKITLSQKTLKEFQDSLLLFFTGVNRFASEILKEQKKNIEIDKTKQERLEEMVAMTYLLRKDLKKGNITSLGKYLHENWLLKRALTSTITNNTFDEIYNLALKNGAIGGKILGAGGGGYFLFYCPKEKQKQLINALPLTHMKIEFDDKGSIVI